MNERRTWTLYEYNEQFNRIPELRDLSSTPFMIEVVTEILPTLKGMRKSLNEIKSSLNLIFGELPTEIIWAELQGKEKEKESAKDQVTDKVQVQVPTDIDNQSSERLLDQEESEADVLDIESTSLLSDLAIVQTHLDLSRNDEKSKSVFKRINTFAEKIGKKLYPMLLNNELECPERMQKHKENLDSFMGYISYGIEQALRRQPVRRSLIYDAFTNLLIDREINKAMSSRSAISPIKLGMEARAYAKQLAHYLTFEGLTKLAQRNVSELFSKRSTVDVFFLETDLAEAARRAAPVKVSAGFLSFIHKTVQEFYVAQIIIQELQETVHETNLSEEILKEMNSHLTASVKVKAQLSLRDQRELNECVAMIQSGSVGKIDLSTEYAVIDFIADYLLSDNEALKAIEFCHNLIEYVYQDSANNYLSNLFVKNLIDIFTKPLPRRREQTILHLAAITGSEALLSLALHVLSHFIETNNLDSRNSRMNLNEFIDRVDVDNKTPFFIAMEGRHSEICLTLLNRGCNPLIKANSEVAVTLLDSVDVGSAVVMRDSLQAQQLPFNWSHLDNLDTTPTGSRLWFSELLEKNEKDLYFMKKFVVASPLTSLDLKLTTSGVFMFEVDIEETTIGHKLFVGWASNEASLNTSKYNEGIFDFHKIHHIGYDGKSVSFDRATRKVGHANDRHFH